MEYKRLVARSLRRLDIHLHFGGALFWYLPTHPAVLIFIIGPKPSW